MQKKIIALAIASAFAAPALALADSGNVVVYGQANVSYDMVSTGTPAGTGATPGTNSNRVSSNSSRIGVKGSEDLGGGTSAIWQIESGVAMDNAGGSLGTRDTFAGLSSASLGTVIMGRHDTPYKMSTRNLDLFADGIADNRALMGGGARQWPYTDTFDLGAPDVLAYLTPNINGFSGALAYINLAETNRLSTQEKAHATSVAGMYDVAPFYATIAYESHDFGSAGGDADSEKATKFGFGYTQSAFNVGFVYEKTSDNFDCNGSGGDCYGHKAYYLSGKYNVSSSDAVKVAYTKAGKTADATANEGDDAASQFSLGYDHNLSKRTTVYALYTSLKNGDDAKYDFSSAASSGGLSSVHGSGGSPHVLSFGMKHSF